ncbi:MAG: 2-succinyl-5-enolpyruvyl-6-hydroxy-3-cyclohexene-1-carboxylic-acid synthase [Aliivibrio sp.]|uniref:2-succinyl-5-enolpyruvyl-6-hydroxy-3- cyclohexene-1-carboxylic-acid synthase n=1 Tax=Aliivibrio sp. TaxID=1872443 RepID=UPI001A4C00AD|nr:2-succinyl-5-enolpyruvyl-6-hydroxy-3-cyclohexene-1-carboxylic-acid synthase [Aliivibrio sp.]
MSWKAQQASLNRLWAALIIEELTRCGVKHLCLAPGSRSTPLAIAASKNSNLSLHTHFDERGLGFFALGLAKVESNAVAVVVTSGTAVANLLPCVVESGLTKEKLILLTSDRPVDQIDCGANQAINQTGIFSSHVTTSFNLPSPTLTISPCWLLSAIDKLMSEQSAQGGSLHINCPYPEPLYGDDVDFANYLVPLLHWQHSHQPFVSIIEPQQTIAIADDWHQMIKTRGVIVAGKLTSAELTAVRVLAKSLQWPLLLDPQACGSSEWAHYDLWLQNQACCTKLEQAQSLLQVGARVVSKRLGQFIEKQPWLNHWMVTPHSGLLVASHQPHHRINHNILDWLNSYQLWLDSAVKFECSSMGWADELIESSDQVKALCVCSTLYSEKLSELSFATSLESVIAENTTLFIGNSLIIRLVDMVSCLPDLAVYSNRGASGIDGLIATAAGIQCANKQPLLCLIGDTSLLYDLNSLPLLAKNDSPTVIVVTNNDGGAIFDLLPVSEQQKESLYRMPHGFEFSHAAAMFGIDYCQPETLSAAINAVRDGLSSTSNQTRLVEIKTSPGQAGIELKTLFSVIQHASIL